LDSVERSLWRPVEDDLPAADRRGERGSSWRGSMARRFAAIVASLGPLTAGGCVTTLLWDSAPQIHERRVIAAHVDEAGGLALAVETSDGRRHAYHDSPRIRSMYPLFMEELPPDAVVDWDVQPASTGAIELPPTYRIAKNTAGERLVISMDARGRSVQMCDDRGDFVAAGVFRGMGGTAWNDPGTWLRVAATPITVAFDAVTLPFQAFFVFVLWRKA
jgi:hypothetical protein